MTQPPSQSQNIYTTTKTVNSLGLGEFYLKLLFFPGLLSNFLLSKGNLSPPISNIFSASCKKRRHYFILDQMKPIVYTSPFSNHHNFYLIFSPFIVSIIMFFHRSDSPQKERQPSICTYGIVFKKKKKRT